MLLLTAVDMSVIRRIASECSSVVRHFYRGILAEQSSRRVNGVHSITSCHSMASSGTDLNSQEHKDNVRKFSEEADAESSAKRLKTAESSLENDVGIACISFCTDVCHSLQQTGKDDLDSSDI